MLNKTEQEVVGLLLKAPFEGHTVYGIAKKLNRYVSQVQKAIAQLKKDRVVTIKKLGPKSSVCNINLSTADIDTITAAAVAAKTSFLKKQLKISIVTKDIEDKMAKHQYIMLIFGSHTKETRNKSDIDICFIIQDEKRIEEFKSKVKAILSNFTYKIHPQFFTMDWFYEMMKEKDTVGREILKNSVVLHGFDSYYGMVRKHDQETGYSESDIHI